MLLQSTAPLYLVLLGPLLLKERVRARDLLVMVALGIGLVALLTGEVTPSVTAPEPAFEAALLLLIEPVFNPLWAWWVHGELPGPATLAGGALIVAVTVAKTWLDTREGDEA